MTPKHRAVAAPPGNQAWHVDGSLFSCPRCRPDNYSIRYAKHRKARP